MGSMSFPALVWPTFLGSFVWQTVQEGVSGLPPVELDLKSDSPRSAENPPNAESVAFAWFA